MIGNDVLKMVLAESKAEFVQANIWTLSDAGNSFVRRWQIDRTQAQEAEEFLRVYLSAENYPNQTRSIKDPIATTKREGTYRGGRVMAKMEISPQSKAEEWFVYQEMRKGFVETLTPIGGTAPSVDWSEFYILNEQAFHANQQQPVLRLNNVAPSAVHDLTAYLNQDSFADIAYRDDTLEGTWYRLPIRAEADDDGSYHIDIPLANALNETLYYTFLQSPDTRKGLLYRREANQTSVDQVTNATWFDADGNKYDEAGTGRYRIGGQDTLPAGWMVLNRSTRRDDQDRLWDIDIEITWTDDYRLSTAADFITYHKSAKEDVVVDQGFGIPDSMLATISAEYANLGDDKQANFQFQRDKENGTFNFTASVTTRSCRQGYLDTGSAWILYGSGTISTSAIEVPTDIDGSGTRLWAQLKTTLSAFEVQASVRPEDDGTFAYNIQVMKPASSTKTFSHSGDYAVLDATDGWGDEDGNETVGLRFSGDMPEWITDGVMICIESDTTDSDVKKVLGIFKVGDTAQFGESFVVALSKFPLPWPNFYDKAVTCTLTVDPHKASTITQRWVDSARGATVLPTDIHSSYDEENGSWYDDVDFKYELAGTLFNWTRVTTRHQVKSAEYVPSGFQTKWKKEDVTKSVSFQPVGRKTRGKWKEEVVPWVTEWDDYVAGASHEGETPPTWGSMGYQAKYGDWKDWFVKASIVGSTIETDGDNFGDFIGRANTGNFRYSADHFGMKGINFWYKSQEGTGEVDGGWLGVSSLNQNVAAARNLASFYSAKIAGFSVYSHEVVKLRMYSQKEEFIRWNTAWDFSESVGYAIGDVVFYSGAWYQFTSTHSAGAWNAGHVTTTITNNPASWDLYGYVDRYGDFNTAAWIKATVSSGDNVGDFIGVSGAASHRYQPPPETDGIYLYYMSQQGTGAIDGGWLGVSSLNQNVAEARNLDNIFSAKICGYSVYTVALVRAGVLNELGEPELEDGGSLMIAPSPYEHPYFCHIGQRTRTPITIRKFKRYYVVNPELITNNPIPATKAAALADTGGISVSPYDSNAEVAYEVTRLSEYLWMVEKQAIFYGEKEPDTTEASTNPDETGKLRNFPPVDANGFYMFYHAPTIADTILGKSPTVGKYPGLRIL